MLQFHDPISLGIAAGALTTVSAIGGAVSASREASAEAKFLKIQAQREEVQAGREIRDLRQEQRRASSRTRAILAAQGVDLSSGTAIGLIAGREAEALIREQRITEDSRFRARSLRARARNVRAAGRAAATQSLLSGAARNLSSAAALGAAQSGRPT